MNYYLLGLSPPFVIIKRLFYNLTIIILKDNVNIRQHSDETSLTRIKREHVSDRRTTVGRVQIIPIIVIIMIITIEPLILVNVIVGFDPNILEERISKVKIRGTKYKKD